MLGPASHGVMFFGNKAFKWEHTGLSLMVAIFSAALMSCLIYDNTAWMPRKKNNGGSQHLIAVTASIARCLSLEAIKTSAPLAASPSAVALQMGSVMATLQFALLISNTLMLQVDRQGAPAYP